MHLRENSCSDAHPAAAAGQVQCTGSATGTATVQPIPFTLDSTVCPGALRLHSCTCPSAVPWQGSRGGFHLRRNERTDKVTHRYPPKPCCTHWRARQVWTSDRCTHLRTCAPADHRNCSIHSLQSTHRCVPSPPLQQSAPRV